MQNHAPQTIIISAPEGKKDETLEKKGGLPENRFAYCELLGRRKSQEDALVGAALSPEDLQRLSPQEIGYRLWSAYKILDAEFRKNPPKDHSGSTAITTVYDGKNHLITAGLGDSEAFAVIYNKKREVVDVVYLNTERHSLEDEMEAKRIREAGGRIQGDRVQSKVQLEDGYLTLNMTRAIGDVDFGSLVPADANIYIHSLDKLTTKIGKDDIGEVKIITTCDGFTECAYDKAQYLENLLKQQQQENLNEQELANHLANAAYVDGSKDNISVSVHTLERGKPFFQGVYDGHGGNNVASQVAQKIFNIFQKLILLNAADYKGELHSVYNQKGKPSNQHIFFERDHPTWVEEGFEMSVETRNQALEEIGNVPFRQALTELYTILRTQPNNHIKRATDALVEGCLALQDKEETITSEEISSLFTTYEDACKAAAPSRHLLKWLGVVIITGIATTLCATLGAVAGAGLGILIGIWTGPGVLGTSAVGAGSGAITGWVIGMSLFGAGLAGTTGFGVYSLASHSRFFNGATPTPSMVEKVIETGKKCFKP